MVTVICQHSKLEFEAATRRTKQHPDIANLKAKANKDGNYREVNDALSEATKQGGYTTIDEYMTLVHEIIDGKMRKQRERVNRQAQAQKEYEAERERIRAERRQQNDLLKQNGYRWQKEVVTDEDAHPMDYRESGVYWHLIAPDDLEISKERALEAIERGLEVVRQEIADRLAIAAKKAEAEKAEKERQEAEERAIIATFDSKVAEIKATCERIERFEYDYSQREVIANTYSGRNFRVYRSHDEILKFVIDGIDHFITIVGTGYDDDGYYTYYRQSDNPTTDESQSSLDATLNLYFG